MLLDNHLKNISHAFFKGMGLPKYYWGHNKFCIIKFRFLITAITMEDRMIRLIILAGRFYQKKKDMKYFKIHIMWIEISVALGIGFNRNNNYILMFRFFCIKALSKICICNLVFYYFYFIIYFGNPIS